jgi:RNA-directed DNA polymerase
MRESATATDAWTQRPWRTREVAVCKLERRSYTASYAGDSRRVHRLQPLLLQSRAAQRLAVRRVTQDNHGKNTAGMDGITSLPPQRGAWAAHLPTLPLGRPPRRVWMPKRGPDDTRPLSLPTLHARALHALVKLVLEPAWAARFAPKSAGCRPGRSVHAAIGAIVMALEKPPKDALDADIAPCFARIDPHALLRQRKTFPPLNRLVQAWRQAGGLDTNVCTATTRGTPQGGDATLPTKLQTCR